VTRLGSSEDIIEESKEVPVKFRRRGFSRLKLCPNCLSPVHPADSISGFILPEEYSCDKCHYRGHVFLERQED
jgi:hypothetical protein